MSFDHHNKRFKTIRKFQKKICEVKASTLNPKRSVTPIDTVTLRPTPTPTPIPISLNRDEWQCSHSLTMCMGGVGHRVGQCDTTRSVGITVY